MAAKKSTLPRSIALVICVGLLAILAGCSRSELEVQAKVPPGNVLLTGAGATFPSVLYGRWFAVYHHDNPNVVIKYPQSVVVKAFDALSEKASPKKRE